MSIQHLINAVTLDTRLIIIMASLAAALLAVVVIVVCCVRAQKKRNKSADLKTSKDDAQPHSVDAKSQQAVSDNTSDAVAQPAEPESRLDDTDDESAVQSDEPADFAATETDIAEDTDEEIAVHVSNKDDDADAIVYRTIRYNRSFLARLTQADDEVKARYSALKNHLLSYQKVKPALSWKRESFRLGRSTFACFVMRGKKLCLCFATDPKRFDGTKYKVIDLSIRSPKSKQPCKYRIISDRRVTYAKEIIDMLMTELSVAKLAEHYEQNYTMPYRETDALIQDGLIKVKIIDGVDSTVTTLNDVEQIKSIVKQSEQLPKRDFKILPKVEVAEVNVMSDAEATKLIEYKVVKRKKSKGAKGIINIDVLSKKFPSGARITIDVLREQRIIPNNVNYIKVLAKGILDKPLIIEADDFSLAAVKMIALTGGRVIRTSDK